MRNLESLILQAAAAKGGLLNNKEISHYKTALVDSGVILDSDEVVALKDDTIFDIKDRQKLNGYMRTISEYLFFGTGNLEYVKKDWKEILDIFFNRDKNAEF